MKKILAKKNKHVYLYILSHMCMTDKKKRQCFSKTINLFCCYSKLLLLFIFSVSL